MRFDHLILLVDDVDTWSRRFADAGFTVADRQDRGGGPDHRFICLENGTYIEVIHATADDPHAPPWVARMQPLGDGFGAYSFNTNDIERTFRSLPGSAGLEPMRIAGSVDSVGDWSALVATPRMDDSLVVPFVLEDLAGADVRVPRGAARSHQNRVSYLAGITLLVEDTHEVSAQLSPVLGTPASVPSPDWAVDSGIMFRLGSGQWLAMYAPLVGTWAAEHLRLRGPGPVEVALASHARAAEVAGSTAEGSLVAEMLPVRVTIAV